MKRMITKLAANANRMKSSIKHMLDAYEKGLNELSDIPDFPQLYGNCEMR